MCQRPSSKIISWVLWISSIYTILYKVFGLERHIIENHYQLRAFLKFLLSAWSKVGQCALKTYTWFPEVQNVRAHGCSHPQRTYWTNRTTKDVISKEEWHPPSHFLPYSAEWLFEVGPQEILPELLESKEVVIPSQAKSHPHLEEQCQEDVTYPSSLVSGRLHSGCGHLIRKEVFRNDLLNEGPWAVYCWQWHCSDPSPDWCGFLSSLIKCSARIGPHFVNILNQSHIY